jgi:isoleucyl-tRNA synthetase
VRGIEHDLDAYDLAGACQRVLAFIDALNNWYIRRSRERFWGSEDDADKRDAYDTLYTALVVLCRAASPLLPLITEEIHTGLTGEASVHLQDWPTLTSDAADPELVADMDRVRDVCSAALALRADHNARVRQPLAKLTVVGAGSDRIAPHLDLVADEVNVKEVELGESIDAYAEFGLKVNARVLGPRLGGEMKTVLAAAKKGEWRSVDGGVEVAGHRLEESEYDLTLSPKEGVACQALPGNDAIVVLDLELTPELVQEGMARDVIRVIQQARKDAGLHVSDRITLHLELEDAWRAAVDRFEDQVRGATLATAIHLEAPDSSAETVHDAEVGGTAIRIGLRRV